LVNTHHHPDENQVLIHSLKICLCDATGSHHRIITLANPKKGTTMDKASGRSWQEIQSLATLSEKENGRNKEVVKEE
jgi:hypothetical protein